MKQVQCTVGKLYELTNGKVYEVYEVAVRGTGAKQVRVYEIVNDAGVRRPYAARKFKELIDPQPEVEVLKLD